MVKFTLVLGVTALKCATATWTQIMSQLKNTTDALYRFVLKYGNIMKMAKE